MSAGLEASNLSHTYRGRGFPGRRRAVPALQNVSLQVAAGDSLGLVGSSGSGKSTLLRSLLALEPASSGTVQFDGRPVRPGPASSLRWYRRLVQYVPQNPAGTLDPRMTVRELLVEPLRQLNTGGDHPGIIAEALKRVELPPSLLDRRPGELSGGQNQRVAIARSLVPSPRILLADEPVSGLDLPLKNTVLAVLDTLVRRDGVGLLFVSHDLAAVARLCAHTAVLSAGRIVEQGPTSALLADPQHQATQELIRSVPRLPTDKNRR